MTRANSRGGARPASQTLVGGAARAGDLAFVGDDALGPVVKVVCQAALDLFTSLPERPRRLRVRAAQVSVDVDWRSSPVPVPPAAHGEPVDHATTTSPVDRGGPLVAENPIDLYYICAPTVGTFYHALEPGAPPFVTAGALVNVGQQVGIVEAMKLMLPVEADRAGRVVDVLVANGQAVEYGQQLLALGPVELK